VTRIRDLLRALKDAVVRESSLAMPLFVPRFRLSVGTLVTHGKGGILSLYQDSRLVEGPFGLAIAVLVDTDGDLVVLCAVDDEVLTRVSTSQSSVLIPHRNRR
jgi:hypothetical protein